MQIKWRVIKSESTGRFFVVDRDLLTASRLGQKINMYTNAYGAGDFTSEVDAKIKAEELNNFSQFSN